MFIAGTRAAVKTNQSKPISQSQSVSQDFSAFATLKKKEKKKLFKDQLISILNVGCITCEILCQIF